MTTITLPRAVAEQALEALNSIDIGYRSPSGNPLEVSFDEEKCEAAITALRAALARQDEPVEPVAWMFELARNFNLEGYGGWEKRITEYRPNTPEGSVRNVTPLYTSPPQRKPLLKHDQHCVDVPGYGLTAVRLVRAVERAHGIKE